MIRNSRPRASQLKALLDVAAVVALLAAPVACLSRGTSPPNEPDPETRAARAPLMAGAAARDITPALGDPDHPVFMGGLERGLRATGVSDRLHARALVLTDGAGRGAGLVVLDLIGFFHDDVLAVRDELALRHPEVKLDHLGVASTHTHAGPDVIGLWTPIGGSVDAGYIARVRSEAVEAVFEAWQRRRAADLYLARTAAPGLARDTRLPELIDDLVMVMGLRAAGTQEGIASLVNWNSHPSVTGGENSLLSADYPRGVVSRMEARWGGTALFASGDLGGQIGSGRVKVPDPATGRPPEDRLRRAELLGETIADLAMAALGEVAPEPLAGAGPLIEVRSRTLFVPLDNARFAEGLSIGLIRPRRLYPSEGGPVGQLPSEVPDRSSLGSGRFSLRTEVAVVDVGPVRWLLVPGELYPELALGGIQEPQDPGADHPGAPKEPALRPLAGRPSFLIGLANDELGYIIPRSQWDSSPPYAYGRDEAQYGERNSLGPRTAPLLMQAFSDLLSPARD